MSHGIHNIPELDREGLREFGLVTAGIIAVLFGLFFPWLLDFSYPVWPWVISGVLATWAIVAPGTLKQVYKLWMRFGLLLNRITMPIIMGVVFYLVIAPIALVMRMLKNDPMTRQFDDNLASYRIGSKKASVKNMEKPF